MFSGVSVTEIGVGGIFALIVIKTVFEYTKGIKKVNGSVMTKEDCRQEKQVILNEIKLSREDRKELFQKTNHIKERLAEISTNQ